MALTVSRLDLELLGGLEITEPQHAALHRAVLAVIATGYRGDVNTASGATAAVLDGVYTSIALRILTNPTGARSIGLGTASVTTGGSDEALSNPFTLTTPERQALTGIGGIMPTVLHFRPRWPARLPSIPREGA